MSETFADFSSGQPDDDDISQLIARAKSEWKLLKEHVAKLHGQPYKKTSLAWIEGTSMLALDDVVAAFEEYPGRSLLHHYRVVFSRRPSGPMEAATEDAPYQSIWDLEPKIQGTAFLWHVDDLNKTLPASELSHEIAIQLAKYDDDYKDALREGGFDSE